MRKEEHFWSSGSCVDDHWRVSKPYNVLETTMTTTSTTGQKRRTRLWKHRHELNTRNERGARRPQKKSTLSIKSIPADTLENLSDKSYSLRPCSLFISPPSAFKLGFRLGCKFASAYSHWLRLNLPETLPIEISLYLVLHLRAIWCNNEGKITIYLSSDNAFLR